MKSSLIFTLAALVVVLMSNVYVGRAEEEPFEIVWKKDIGRGIGSYPLNDFQNFYVASDKIGNFLVYKDDYHSLAVLDLNTGEFKNRIEIEMDNDKEIQKFRLLKNNTRLAVWYSYDWINIYDTKTWTLERKIPGSFDIISEDMTFLVRGAYFFYDYNTLEKINNFYPGGGSIIGSDSFTGILSKDSKKLLSIHYYYPKNDPDVYLFVKVFDLNTYEEIFFKEYDGAVKVFADDSINKVFVNMSNYDQIEINDLKEQKSDTMLISGYYFRPPFIMSKNQKFFYIGENEKDLITFGAISIKKDGPRKAVFDVCTLADVGEDYVIGWVPPNHSSTNTNELIKFKINDEILVPVLETEYEPEILYPNPTNSVVIIPNIQLQNLSELKVFDEKGSDLSKNCQINILPSGVEINMSNFISGIYFIQINNSNSSKSFKVIRN